MRKLKLSTARDVMVLLVASSDHVTGKTGATLTITASKAGGAFASITPTVTERVNGWYSLALTSAHTDTLGDLALHVTATDADPIDTLMEVGPIDGNVLQWNGTAVATPTTAGVPRVDVKAMEASVLTAAATATDFTTEVTAALALSTQVDALEAAVTAIEADTQDIQGRIPAALVAGRIDASVGAMAADVLTAAATAIDFTTEVTSGLATAANQTTIISATDTVEASLTTIAAYLDTEIAAIKAQTDLIPSDPADASVVAGLIAGLDTKLDTIDNFLDTEVAAILAAVDTEVGSIKTTVEALPTADGIIDNECDSTAPAGANTVREILNVVIAALTASGGDLDTDGTVTIRNTGDTKSRIVGTITAGTRVLTTLDGTE